MKSSIEIKNIYKKYRIGMRQPYFALRDSIMNLARNPLSLLKNRIIGKNNIARDEFWALKDISFKVMPGDVVGIIGKNGAGKSTLLKILSRITPPTKGEIILRGSVASLLEVGTGFNAELTGRENIFLNGAILGMKQQEIRRKLNDIVDFSETGKFLDTPVKYYSSGMYMRLAFAVAAHLQPEILIVDEVLAVGDAAFQKKCLGKMEAVAKQGRTVLFVSHNISMIKALCSKAILLDQGMIIGQGKTDEIINKYMSIAKNPVKNKKTDLTGITRASPAKAVIRESWLEDEKGNIISTVPMGNTIRFCYSFESDKLIKNPGFGCNVYSVYGNRVFSFTSYLLTNKRYPDIKKGVVKYIIDELTLLPGKYVITFSLAENRNYAVDSVEMAMSFTVESRDLFLTGMPLENAHGVVYMKGKIEVC